MLRASSIAGHASYLAAENTPPSRSYRQPDRWSDPRPGRPSGQLRPRRRSRPSIGMDLLHRVITRGLCSVSRFAPAEYGLAQCIGAAQFHLGGRGVADPTCPLAARYLVRHRLQLEIDQSSDAASSSVHRTARCGRTAARWRRPTDPDGSRSRSPMTRYRPLPTTALPCCTGPPHWPCPPSRRRNLRCPPHRGATWRNTVDAGDHALPNSPPQHRPGPGLVLQVTAPTRSKR